MKVRLIRKSDNQIITRSNVLRVTKNAFGNIRLEFENGKSLTLQENMFDIKESEQQ